jgi:hypothetical protein
MVSAMLSATLVVYAVLLLLALFSVIPFALLLQQPGVARKLALGVLATVAVAAGILVDASLSHPYPHDASCEVTEGYGRIAKRADEFGREASLALLAFATGVVLCAIGAVTVRGSRLLFVLAAVPPAVGIVFAYAMLLAAGLYCQN